MLDMAAEACHVPIITDAVSGYSETCAPSRRYPDRLRYYCVRTGYGLEIAADIEMRLAGFSVFNPTLFKPATREHRSGAVVRPGKPDRIEPLFKRYCFVQFNVAIDNWRVIRRLRGVEMLFSSDSQTPLAVPDAAIAAIRAQLAPNDCLYPPSHRVQPLSVGSSARVPSSAFPELVGIIEQSDGARVKILMNIMGRGVSVSVAQSQVEPV